MGACPKSLSGSAIPPAGVNCCSDYQLHVIRRRNGPWGLRPDRLDGASVSSSTRNRRLRLPAACSGTTRARFISARHQSTPSSADMLEVNTRSGAVAWIDGNSTAGTGTLLVVCAPSAQGRADADEGRYCCLAACPRHLPSTAVHRWRRMRTSSCLACPCVQAVSTSVQRSSPDK